MRDAVIDRLFKLTGLFSAARRRSRFSQRTDDVQDCQWLFVTDEDVHPATKMCVVRHSHSTSSDEERKRRQRRDITDLCVNLPNEARLTFLHIENFLLQRVEKLSYGHCAQRMPGSTVVCFSLILSSRRLDVGETRSKVLNQTTQCRTTAIAGRRIIAQKQDSE